MSTGSRNREKIKIAFLDIGSIEWTGGLYYYRNLLHAISNIEDNTVQPYVFVGKKIDNNIIDPLRPFATVVRSPLFDSHSLSRNISRIVYFFSGSNILRNHFLKKYDIQIVSHSNIIEKKPPFKTINWIPDFQHLHLPDIFPAKDIKKRNKQLQQIARRSDVIIVSSNDALMDLQQFSPRHANSARVLHFVSHVKFTDYNEATKKFQKIKKKYSLTDKFFFLPNQFWKHKNHQLVLESVHILNRLGTQITVVCSGYMHDHRNIHHVDQLKKYIKKHQLEKNIKFLGLIDRNELFTLMRFSLAVINPSLFEGWSSTVEEAKSLGKTMILSDLRVHKEQNPPSSVYFDPYNAKELAEILNTFWMENEGGPNHLLEKEAKDNLNARMNQFGIEYKNIVDDVLR